MFKSIASLISSVKPGSNSLPEMSEGYCSRAFWKRISGGMIIVSVDDLSSITSDVHVELELNSRRRKTGYNFAAGDAMPLPMIWRKGMLIKPS